MLKETAERGLGQKTSGKVQRKQKYCLVIMAVSPGQISKSQELLVQPEPGYLSYNVFGHIKEECLYIVTFPYISPIFVYY